MNNAALTLIDEPTASPHSGALTVKKHPHQKSILRDWSRYLSDAIPEIDRKHGGKNEKQKMDENSSDRFSCICHCPVCLAR